MATTEKDKLKRNYRLQEFFRSKGYDVKVLGKIDNPAVVYDGMVLNCYVKNFDLIFTNKPFNGEELFRVKLTHKISTEHDDAIEQWLHLYEHRKIYKLQITCNNKFMYYVGKRENKPAFSTDGFYFFNYDSAKEVAKELKQEFGINTKII